MSMPQTPAWQRFRALRLAARLTRKDVEHATGIRASALQSREERSKKPFLDVQTAQNLASELEPLGIDPAALIALAGIDLLHHTVPTPPATGSSQRQDLAMDLPVMGVAVGGDDGAFHLNGNTIDYVRRPPGLWGNRTAFALYVTGDSMEPRYESGDILYINPQRPAKAGDYVLIELKPDATGSPGIAMLKRLRRRTAEQLQVLQFNPHREFDIARRDVLHEYKILDTEELIGL